MVSGLTKHNPLTPSHLISNIVMYAANVKNIFDTHGKYFRVFILLVGWRLNITLATGYFEKII